MSASGKHEPVIYVVVVTWNQYALTAACVRSLLLVNYPNLHILIVDNASQDDTTEKLCQEFKSGIEILTNARNLGYAGGNNVGIKHALQHSADYVMILNNDTVVDPDCITPLLVRLSGSERAGAVTPKIYFMDQPATIWAAGGRINPWIGKAGSRGRGEDDTGQLDQPETVDYTTGCCFLAPRTIFEQAGPFDKRYFAYFEDLDWSLRVRSLGLDIWYEPASHVWHVAGASSANTAPERTGTRSPFIIYLLARNNLWFIRTHLTGIKKLSALSYFLLCYVPVYTAAYVILRRWQKLRGLSDGVRDGLTEPMNSNRNPSLFVDS